MRFVAAVAVITLGAGPRAAAPVPPGPLGLVVENVATESPAHLAGVRAGDVLLAWNRAAAPPENPEPAAGELRSPFDLTQVLIEQAPRGPLTIVARRDGEERSFTLPPVRWTIAVRPQLPDDVLAEYEAGAAQVAGGQAEAGALRWQHAIETLRAHGDATAALWL